MGTKADIEQSAAKLEKNKATAELAEAQSVLASLLGAPSISGGDVLICALTHIRVITLPASSHSSQASGNALKLAWFGGFSTYLIVELKV